jgi:hypothetical protein
VSIVVCKSTLWTECLRPPVTLRRTRPVRQGLYLTTYSSSCCVSPQYLAASTGDIFLPDKAYLDPLKAEDGDSMFLRNIGMNLRVYTASKPRRISSLFGVLIHHLPYKLLNNVNFVNSVTEKWRSAKGWKCGLAEGGEISPNSRDEVESPFIFHIFPGVSGSLAAL